MKVSELIKALHNCNPDALVLLTVGGEDEDIFSSSEFVIMGKDEDLGYIELFMSDQATQQV